MRLRIPTLAIVMLAVCAGGAEALADELFAIYPPYPYRAGYYPKGRLVLSDAALRRVQAFLLSQALFHDGAGAEPLPLHAAHLPRL